MNAHAAAGPAPWLLFGVLCAFFYASHGAQTKRLLRDVDNAVVVWSTAAFALPVTLVFVGAEGLAVPTPSFWWALGGVLVLNGTTFLLYNHAIRISDLSLVVPLLAFTPLFMLVTSGWILNERPGALGTAGIGLVVLGALALKREGSVGMWGPLRAIAADRGARWMLLVALLWSITANLDKVAVEASSPATYLLSFQTGFALLFLPSVVREGARAQVAKRWRGLLLLGVLAALMSLTQMIALRLTLAPYVIATKRSGMVFSILYGHYLFREPGIRHRIAGAAAMVAGMFLLACSAAQE